MLNVPPAIRLPRMDGQAPVARPQSPTGRQERRGSRRGHIRRSAKGGLPPPSPAMRTAGQRHCLPPPPAPRWAGRPGPRCACRTRGLCGCASTCSRHVSSGPHDGARVTSAPAAAIRRPYARVTSSVIPSDPTDGSTSCSRSSVRATSVDSNGLKGWLPACHRHGQSGLKASTKHHQQYGTFHTHPRGQESFPQPVWENDLGQRKRCAGAFHGPRPIRVHLPVGQAK